MMGGRENWEKAVRIDKYLVDLYNKIMEIVSDAISFLAVALDENKRDWVIEKTAGLTIISPEVLPYEIGNALIALRKKGRLNEQEIIRAFSVSQEIAVRLVSIKVHEALKTAIRCNVYAYDAYYLQCCIENSIPLISLDGRMCEAAKSLGIKVMV
jgi:predicted nucleic acid-binding protein